MAGFQLGQTARITAVVAEHVTGTEEVIVWISGCTVPCQIKPTEKVEVGDPSVSMLRSSASASKLWRSGVRGKTLTIHPKYAVR